MKSHTASALALALLAPIAALAAPPAVTSTPLARVGTHTITREHVEREVQQFVDSSYFHKGVSDEEMTKLQREQLGADIRRALNTLGGLDAGMKLPVSEAKTKCAETEKKLGRAEYERSIAFFGWTRKGHQRVVAETLIGNAAYKEFVTDRARAADQEVKATWERTKSAWEMPESLRVSHIFLRLDASTDAPTRGKKMDAAKDIAARLKNGEDFADLATKRSEDDYRIKGGDLGLVHRGRLVPELETAVWAAKPGQIVGPVVSSIGIHIAKVAARSKTRALTYAEAAPLVRAQLEKQRLADADTAWFTGLRKKYPVTILDPALR